LSASERASSCLVGLHIIIFLLFVFLSVLADAICEGQASHGLRLVHMHTWHHVSVEVDMYCYCTTWVSLPISLIDADHTSSVIIPVLLVSLNVHN
jgi:hypothetical protein